MNQLELEPDVLVVGAGSAGIAASVSSARAGAVTLLVDANEFIGGTAAGAWVGTICGLYLNGIDECTPCCGGFPIEFTDKIAGHDGTAPIRNSHGLWFCPYKPSTFSSVASRLIEDAGVLALRVGRITTASFSERQITRVTVQIKEKVVELRPRTVIDCSGDSVISRLLGIGVKDPSRYQANAIVFEIHGTEELPDNRTTMLHLLLELQRGVLSGTLPETCQRISLVDGHSTTKKLLVKVNLPAQDLSERGIKASIEREARELVPQIIRCLQSGNSPLRTARLGAVAPQVGFRSGARLDGKACLTRDDVLELRKVEKNAVSKGSWPIEEWIDHRRPSMTYLPNGGTYDVEADTLRSRHIDNVFSAGRCFSADDGAIASARVIGTCLQTGWAAARLAVASLDNCLDTKLADITESIRADLEFW